MIAADPNTAEWITAGASILAAFGTIGAVAVALWQSMARDKTKVRTVIRHIAPREEHQGDLYLFSLVNVGPRPLQISTAYLIGRDGTKVKNYRAEATLKTPRDNRLLFEGSAVDGSTRIGMDGSIMQFRGPHSRERNPTVEEIAREPEPCWIVVEDVFQQQHRILLPDVQDRWYLRFRGEKRYKVPERQYHSAEPFDYEPER